jgi:hypothetical protein
MTYIHGIVPGGDTESIAFTETNTPGFSEDNPATREQMEAHVGTMNERAVALGIKTRYEVRD